jgi:hypothetical protein
VNPIPGTAYSCFRPAASLPEPTFQRLSRLDSYPHAAAFHNHVAPMFHQTEAAARAWDLTLAFLQRTLPV